MDNLDERVRRDTRQCPGSSSPLYFTPRAGDVYVSVIKCTCCRDGCDCGCRDACPRFRYLVAVSEDTR